MAQSAPLSTDRASITVANIPDYFGGPNLKVLRTDAGTPLRAGTAWIWEGGRQEEPNSYYASMRQKGLNAVRMILFDTWQIEAGYTITDWNDAAYRTRQLDRMERAVNYASANGMYIIINSHNKIPEYNESYANALWTHVAPYFANRTHVIYEASNEPMPGIGVNGDMDMGAAGATSSPRLQALKRTFNIMRAAAPNTHIMVITPNGISDYGFGTGLGNLAASFAQLPGMVDWTKTSVAYHLYHNDGAAPVSINAGNLRNFHSRYPGWPSENNFPASVSNAMLGITDNFRSPQFDNDIYVNQTCERLGLGWSMWNINGQTELDRNWPIMYSDAVAKNWTWITDPFTPDTEAPSVPTNMVAAGITATTATLSWTASTDNVSVSGYEVFNNGISIGTTATNTITLTGLACATTAAITVKARDLAGNWSAASASLNVTTSACPTSFVIEAENNFTIVNDLGTNCAIGVSSYGATTASNGLVVGLCDIGDEISISVNIPVTGLYDISVRVRSGWTGDPGHFINNNKYEYRVNDVIRTFSLVAGSITTTIDVDSYYGTVKLSAITLPAGLNYVRIKALQNWAKVDFVRVELLTDTQAPGIPTGLASSAVTGTGFTLSWMAPTDNAGVTAYEVFNNNISLGTTAGTSFNVTGLSCGTTNSMTVRARDAAGNWSAASSVLIVSTTALPNAGTISATNTLCVGATAVFTSNGLAGGIWSSSNTAIASVNATGTVSGLSPGTSIISYTVSANGCTSNTTSSVTVNAVPNAGTITGNNSITVGSSTTFSTSGVSGGTWSSSNPAVASVSSSGVVQGLSAGTSSISYTVNYNGCTQSSTASVTVSPANTTNTSIIIRARSVSSPGASFRVEIMDGSAPTGGSILQSSPNFNNLPTNFEDYTFTASGSISPSQIRVRYINDMSAYDFEADYIIVNGTTYLTRSSSTYSVGFWNSLNGCNNAGYLATSLLHCNGYFHYLATPTSTQIVVRARSVSRSGASFRVEIMNGSAATGGTILQSSPNFNNLSTNFADYTFTASGNINPNQVRVRYINDKSNYDFETDYIIVNGTTYQTEAPSTYSVGFRNTINGCSNAGFLSNSLLICNGYFHFEAGTSSPLLRSAKQVSEKFSISIFPNPAKDYITVNLSTDKSQQVNIKITNANSLLVTSLISSVREGKNTITIPINQLSQGLFILTVQSENKFYSAKFIVIQ